jgi:hypothetical protein
VSGFKSEIIVKQIDPSYFPRAAIFLEKMTNNEFPKELWIDRFHLWWEDNPVFYAEKPSGWILTDGENIVGFFAVIPVHYHFKGEEIPGHSATSWFVDPEYRKHSLKLIAPFVKAEQPCLLINSTPSKDVAIKIFKYYKLTLLKQPWLKVFQLFPVQGSQLWCFLVGRKFGESSFAEYLVKLDWLIGSIIDFLQRCRISSLKNNSNPYSVREIFYFSEDYNKLWEKFKNKYDLLAIRDSSRLNWFFFSSKNLSSLRRVLEIRNDLKLMGYVVVNVVRLPVKNRQYYFYDWIDSMIVGGGGEVYFAILRALYELAAKDEKNIILIRTTSFDPYIEKYLTRFGFQQKTEEQNILLRYPNNELGANKLVNTNLKEYFSPLDGDRGFFIG